MVEGISAPHPGPLPGGERGTALLFTLALYKGKRGSTKLSCVALSAEGRGVILPSPRWGEGQDEEVALLINSTAIAVPDDVAGAVRLIQVSRQHEQQVAQAIQVLS